MTDRLAGKTAFVTAAGQGIGRATAIAFAKEGAKVWATDINEASLSSLAQEHGSIETRRLDVTDGTAIRALADELGAVDVLFNCAGFVHNGTILDCEEKDWDFSFDVNIKGAFRTTRAFLPAMIEAGGGSILNISSVASSVIGVRNRFVYGATKAAVIGFTKAIAADFVDKGIRCNAICPGTIDSPSLNERFQATPDPEQTRREFMARQPMGRLGTPEEVAALAVYLVSDDAAFSTGAYYLVDGGWTMS